MRKVKSERGFARYDFKDLYGYECSIQESSLATKEAIWLGQNQAGGIPSRMHLDKPRAKKIIKQLQKFVDTGAL